MKNTQTNNTKKENSRLTKAICAAVGVVLIILAILLSLRGCAEDGSASAHGSNNVIGNPGIIYDTGAVEGGWDEADTESIVFALCICIARRDGLQPSSAHNSSYVYPSI